ncbi:MAG: glycerol kinase, partial [Planctomycetaceae bacterium]|nr:glycerol kinase [Planctomycetaceae bacterium]
MSEFILALDQGTTSCRSILFRQDGSIASVAQQEFEQILPQPGHVEHDAKEIWETQLATAQQVLSDSSVALESVKAIGITNQRETT